MKLLLLLYVAVIACVVFADVVAAVVVCVVVVVVAVAGYLNEIDATQIDFFCFVCLLHSRSNKKQISFLFHDLWPLKADQGPML
jgi:hypothetical protein